MSKIALSGNASGTGTFTIASPNSNTDRTQTLPDNTGTLINTGSTGVITNAMLANSFYPDQSYVSTDMVSTGFTSTSWANLGGISIPSAGKWLLWSQLRIRFGATAYFIKAGLFTSSSSGTGEILDSGGSNQLRMLIERVATNGGSFGNLLLTPEWFVDMPTGLSYPFTVYLQVQANASDVQSLNNNDFNGVPTISALKVAATTTSGTTITCQ